MTREEKENLIQHLKYNLEIGADYLITDEDAVEIIKALEQEPCEDAISRQKAQAELKNCEIVNMRDEDDNFIGYYNADTVDSIVLNLPPVTPQPKIGHWILKRTFPTKLYDEYLKEYKCSECYRGIRCTESQLVNYPYCHCGAKMAESEE